MKADNTPKTRFAASRSPALHRLTECGGADLAPLVSGIVAVLTARSGGDGLLRGPDQSPAGIEHDGGGGCGATPGVVSTSPAGVTTKIDVPAHSTEEEYFQACHAATVWMQGHPGDRADAQAERYLAAVQSAGRRRSGHLEHRLGRTAAGASGRGDRRGPRGRQRRMRLRHL